MDPVTVETTIDRPREEVFEYLADVANHAEFTDHFLKDWRLTREDSYGQGAGARFRVDAPLNRFSWGDTTLVELEPPRRIATRGRTGKYNRILTRGLFELEETSGGTRVRFTAETKPKMLSDRYMELFAGRRWFKRKAAKSMRRLRAILEENLDRGQRVTVAGGARKPASAYRFRSPANR